MISSCGFFARLSGGTGSRRPDSHSIGVDDPQMTLERLYGKKRQGPLQERKSGIPIRQCWAQYHNARMGAGSVRAHVAEIEVESNEHATLINTDRRYLLIWSTGQMLVVHGMAVVSCINEQTDCVNGNVLVNLEPQARQNRFPQAARCGTGGKGTTRSAARSAA